MEWADLVIVSEEPVCGLRLLLYHASIITGNCICQGTVAVNCPVSCFVHPMAGALVGAGGGGGIGSLLVFYK